MIMTAEIVQHPVIKGISNLTYSMWDKGWDESNGGNISCLLTAEEVSSIKNLSKEGRVIEVANIPQTMLGKYMAITATRSQFRTVKDKPATDIGIIKIIETGYEILAGFEGGGQATSEFYMHLLSHEARLKVDPRHRVVVHNHASYATALSLVVEPNDKAYTLPLWKVLTESIVVFPDGVGVLPWQLPGTEAIGRATADKLAASRIVVWAFHGILATGSSFQDCFGLIETVDKAAKMYMETLSIKQYDGLTEDNLRDLCKALGVVPHESILTL